MFRYLSFAVLIFGLSGSNVAADTASAATIREKIVGNTLEGTREEHGPFSDYFAENGLILGTNQGAEWQIKGNQFCVFFREEGYEKLQETCFDMSFDGDEVKWLLYGEPLGHAKILPGNPHGYHQE